jgi:exopolyphosphatase/guanosine-5'-triphosphate,3'-diphosphate pyrophosphatase
MHDVGRSKHDKGHHKASYRLIRRLALPLGWSASQLQLAAAAARFHRGALPTLRHKVLRDLALDQKKIVLHLAGILRFANALDVESDGSIPRVSIELKSDVLMISAQGFTAWTRAAEAIAGSAYLLSLVVRRPIVVKSAATRRARTRKSQ